MSLVLPLGLREGRLALERLQLLDVHQPVGAESREQLDDLAVRELASVRIEVEAAAPVVDASCERPGRRITIRRKETP